MKNKQTSALFYEQYYELENVLIDFRRTNLQFISEFSSLVKNSKIAKELQNYKIIVEQVDHDKEPQTKVESHSDSCPRLVCEASSPLEALLMLRKAVDPYNNFIEMQNNDI